MDHPVRTRPDPDEVRARREDLTDFIPIEMCELWKSRSRMVTPRSPK
jgi:hypothetical protein